MFRPEKYVIINGTQLSKNGFKNLSFETSKFSNSISAIRGFGTTLDENNLNTIDTLSVEFYVDATELKEFAYIYSLFKAYGALPIENDYILEKLKGSLTFERSIVDFKDSDMKKHKVVTHLIVFLQQMHITSLEKTNNGYSVNMIFTLHKNGLSASEYKTFHKHFKDWDYETGFTSICETAINKHIKELINKDDPNAVENGNISFASGKGSMDINIYNIEKLNAKNKGKMYITTMPSMMIDNEFDAVEKETLKINVLKQFEDLEAKKTISISNKNIVQIELITNNIISNTPIYGDSIGIKSFLGLGQSTFTVKMIFDENDKKILEELKTLSDKNISSHKIELKQPLVNLFDFHSASVNNIIFNNIEQANGVMVTILFKVNSYNYFDSEKLNFSSIVNYETQINTNRNNSITGFWLESSIEHILKNEKRFVENPTTSREQIDYKKTDMKWGSKKQNQSQSTVEKMSFPYSKPISEFWETVLEITHEKDLMESGNSDIYKTYVGNFLSYYNSPITAFQVFKKGEVNGIKRQSKNRPTLIPKKNDDNKELFFSKHFNVDRLGINFDTLIELLKEEEDYDNELLFGLKHFYNYCDIIACYTALSNDNIKNSLAKACTKDKLYSTQMYNIVFKDFISNLYNPSSNKFNSNETFVSTMVIKEFYDKLPFILRKPAIKKIVDEINKEAFFSATNTLYYKQIHKRTTELFDAFYKEFITALADEHYINLLTSSIMETENIELYKDSIKEMTKETVKKLINELRKEYKRIYEADRIDIIDRAYNIFLAKYCFGLSSKCFSPKVYKEVEKDITHEQYLRVILFSSCFMSLLLLRTTYRTDSFGVIFENSVQKIADKISEALDRAYKYDLSTLEKEVRTNFIEVFKSNVTDSYYIDLINFNNIRSKSSSPLIKLNKDYNFFYGKQIENLHPERYVDVVIESSTEHAEDLNSYHDMIDFIDEQKYKFIEDQDYTEWVEIKDPYLLSKIKDKPAALPTLAEGIMRNGDNISHIMKKRIIGNRDPFNELEKITSIVNDWNTKVIPDYDIIVSHKEYFSDYNGAYASIKLNSFFSINNLINVSISKNSAKKIKTAIIKLVDINKQILENSEDGTLGIITNVENRLQFVSINNGDKVEINFGYTGNKKNVFKGYINKVSYFGNILEITCHDTASVLYNYTIDQLTLKSDKNFLDDPNNIITETASNIIDGAKNMFSATQLSNQSWATNRKPSNIKKLSDDAYKFTDKEVRINQFKGATVNSHLFGYTTNSNPRYKLNSPGRDPEAASMYSAAISTFYKQPAFIKSLFDVNNFYNKYNLASMHEQNLEALRSVFGELFEKEQNDLIYYKPTKEMFANMNNVDRDYDTYGIIFNDDEASIVSIDNSGFVSKPEEIEEPIVVPEENKTPQKEETIYKAPEEAKPLEDPKPTEPPKEEPKEESKEETKEETEDGSNKETENKEENKTDESKKDNTESSDKQESNGTESKEEEKDKVADKIDPQANKTDSIEKTEEKKEEEQPPTTENKPPVENEPSSENKQETNTTEPSQKKEEDKIVVVPTPPTITDDGVEKFDSEKPKDDNKDEKDDNVIVKDNTIVTTDKNDKNESSKENNKGEEPKLNLSDYEVSAKPSGDSAEIDGMAGANKQEKPPKKDPPKKEPIKNEKPEADKKPAQSQKPETEKPKPNKPTATQPKPDKPKNEKPTESKKDETPKVEKPSKDKKDEATKKEEGKKAEADKKAEEEKSKLTPVEEVDENDISVIENRAKIFDTMPCRGRKITGIFKEARAKGNAKAGNLRFHLGIDISHMTSGDYKTKYDSEAGEKKDDLLAIADGKVESVTDSGNSGGGKVVKIYHEKLKMKTVYMHLNSFNVKKDDEVKKGDIIGQMGNTGQSGGHHLHFEIHIEDSKDSYVHTDPIDYLGVDFYFDWDANIGTTAKKKYKEAEKQNWAGYWIHWKDKVKYIEDYKKEVEKIKNSKSDTRNISTDVDLSAHGTNKVEQWYNDRTGAKPLNQLSLSSDGFMCMLGHESIILTAYQDKAEVSIGMGHSTASTSGVFVKNGELTKDKELTKEKKLVKDKSRKPDTSFQITLNDSLLTFAIDKDKYHEKIVESFRKYKAEDILLKQHEYDALFSLKYNLPATTRLYEELSKKSNGDMRIIRANFLDGFKAKGKEDLNLKKRRVEEFGLFLFGHYKGITIEKKVPDVHKNGFTFWDVALDENLKSKTGSSFSDTDSFPYYNKKGEKKAGDFSKTDYENFKSNQANKDKLTEFQNDNYKVKSNEEKLKEQANKEKEAVAKKEKDKKNNSKKKKKK